MSLRGRRIPEEMSAAHARLAVALGLLRLVRYFGGTGIRRRLLTLGGVQVGRATAPLGNVRIGGGSGPANLLIGDRCTINDGVFLDASDQLQIGDDVGIGHDVLIMTSSHVLEGSHRRHGTLTTAPVRIGSGAWLCSRCVIQPGVTVGEGAVVLVGAVVTSDVAPNTVVAGIPARTVQHLDPRSETPILEPDRATSSSRGADDR